MYMQMVYSQVQFRESVIGFIPLKKWCTHGYLVVGLKSFHGFWPEHDLQAGLFSTISELQYFQACYRDRRLLKSNHSVVVTAGLK